jgi:hypothetical protein
VNSRHISIVVCFVSCVSWATASNYDSYQRTERDSKRNNPGASVSSFTPRFHWFQNRLFDFCDIFNFGVGATHENPTTGPLTPSFGAYIQVTDFVQLGYLKFGGVAAEWEGRGFGAYTEIRDIWGYTFDKSWSVQQGENAVNFYKDAEASKNWCLRMNNPERYKDESGHIVVHSVSGKRLSPWKQHPRGWHNYAYTGVELALPLGIPYTPLDTHLGFTVRTGIDTSQIADFILGFVGLDFWHDDLRELDVK